MYCTNCGTQNADDASFCRNCGSPLKKSQTGYQQPYQAPRYRQAPYSQRPASSAGTAVLRNVCSSPVALVAIIAYTAAAFFSFLNAVFNSYGILSNFYQIADLLDMRSFYRTLSGSFVALSIIAMIPTVLIAVGLWLTYTSAASKTSAGVKTIGLTIIKVVLIVNLSIIGGLLAIVEIVEIVALSTVSQVSSYYGYYGSASSVMTGSLVGVMIVIAIALALVILFYVKAVKTVNTIRQTAQSGVPSDNVSVFVAVMSFIMGGFTVISIIGSYGALAVFSNLCSATAYITFGVFLLSYRGKMRTAVYGAGYANFRQQPYTSQTPYGTPNDFTVQDTNYGQSADAEQETAETGGNAPQQLVTCSRCGGQYNVSQGQDCRCPYCGNVENE